MRDCDRNSWCQLDATGFCPRCDGPTAKDRHALLVELRILTSDKLSSEDWTRRARAAIPYAVKEIEAPPMAITPLPDCLPNYAGEAFEKLVADGIASWQRSGLASTPPTDDEKQKARELTAFMLASLTLEYKAGEAITSSPAQWKPWAPWPSVSPTDGRAG